MCTPNHRGIIVFFAQGSQYKTALPSPPSFDPLPQSLLTEKRRADKSRNYEGATFFMLADPNTRTKEINFDQVDRSSVIINRANIDSSSPNRKPPK